MNAYILPGVVGVILLVALWKRTPVFDAFLQGALGGLQACVRVLPSLIGLLTAVELCQASGVFALLASFLTPVTGHSVRGDAAIFLAAVFRRRQYRVGRFRSAQQRAGFPGRADCQCDDGVQRNNLLCDFRVLRFHSP